MALDYYVWGTMLERYQRYITKNDQRCQDEDCCIDNMEWFSTRVHWQSNHIISQQTSTVDKKLCEGLFVIREYILCTYVLIKFAEYVALTHTKSESLTQMRVTIAEIPFFIGNYFVL